MFEQISTRLAVSAVVAAGALVLPTAAMADTAVPPLQVGDTRAFLAAVPGGPPAAANRTFTGPLTVIVVGQATCTWSLGIAVSAAGTTWVQSASQAACTTNVPNCFATITSRNLRWGGRLVRDGSSVYRHRMSVAFDLTVSGSGCAPSSTTAYAGVLSPRLTATSGANPATTVFDATSGTVSSVLGPASVSGTLLTPLGPASYWRV